MICKQCGAEVNATDRFCKNCGHVIEKKNSITESIFFGVCFAVVVVVVVMFFAGGSSQNSSTYDEQKRYESNRQLQEEINSARGEKARKSAEEQERARKLAEEENARKIADEERNKQKQILIQNDEMRFYNQQTKDGYYFIEVSADTLISELEINAARASNNFKGKYLKITDGKIEIIDSDGDYFTLDSVSNPSIFSDISCYAKTPNARQEILKLNKSAPATIYGKVTYVGDVLGYKLNILYIE